MIGSGTNGPGIQELANRLTIYLGVRITFYFVDNPFTNVLDGCTLRLSGFQSIKMYIHRIHVYQIKPRDPLQNYQPFIFISVMSI